MITGGPLIGVPIVALDSPFPPSLFRPASCSRSGNTLGLANNNGQSISFRNPDFRVPHADQWMAGGNLELPGNIGLDVAYVGSKVSSLPITRNQNVVPRTEQEKGIARLGGSPAY